MMTRQDRAKQFAPYDALNGFYKAIREKETLYDSPTYLAEDEQTRIELILEALEIGDNVMITYYSDKINRTVLDYIQKIDSIKKKIILRKGLEIRFFQIINIELLS